MGSLNSKSAMSDWNGLNINTWWKAVLIMGILATIGATIFNINFIERKHLFGLGLGMIMIGLGHWMAYKTISTIAFNGILSSKTMKHNFLSIILIAIGIGLVGLFGFFLIKGLV
jgi:hypothetical protein